MSESSPSRVLELFGQSTRASHDWASHVAAQHCPFADTRCFKVRKSDPNVSIGTCSVTYGKEARNIVICPNRLLERRQVFTDCLHLLTRHEPGNELHVVPQVSMPGGSVDYFLVSARGSKVRDFVAIELQTLDTTGTIWPERQRFLKAAGLRVTAKDAASDRPFGMNWKMTAKTTLVQLHHKVRTIEHVGKRIVMAVQECLLDYLRKQFDFAHVVGVRAGDSMHIHAYRLDARLDGFAIELVERLSTDADGVARCMGIAADTRLELSTIVAELEKKISARTLMTVHGPIAQAMEQSAE